MQDYSKLIQALRCCGDVGCHKCPYQKHIHEHFCWTMAMHDAAAAIEALQAKVDKQDAEITELLAVITKKDEEIEALQAQLPKLGEWRWDPNGMDWGIGSWVCKNCKAMPNTYWQSDPDIKPLRFSGSHYCPNCGAKMKDEKRKMEVCGVGYQEQSNHLPSEPPKVWDRAHENMRAILREAREKERAKMEAQDESISKFADGEWWKEVQDGE